MELRIAVLALQGAFSKHRQVLEKLKVKVILANKPEDLCSVDGLIIPGGESSAIWRQLEFIKMMPALKEFAIKKPIFGTCAGLILMSHEIVGHPHMASLDLLNIVTERNAFGRQVESFETDLEVTLPQKKPFKCHAIFIRAPRIKKIDDRINVLAKFGEEPILVQQGIHLGATFHPELTQDSQIHEYFLSLVKQQK